MKVARHIHDDSGSATRLCIFIQPAGLGLTLVDAATALYIYKAKNCKLLAVPAHAQKKKIHI